MQLRSESFQHGAPIPAEFGFCVPAEVGHVALAPNRNPHLAWSGAPAGTRSFVLICHDVDVPSRGDDVNQEGRTVPASLPRVDFFHWVLIDIPASVTEIAAGSHSDGVTPRGKQPGLAPLGQGVQGINDYTGWFAGDASMAGNYGGYDGPCPPWNDEIVHHYHFTIYALDVEQLGLGQPPAAEGLKGLVSPSGLKGLVSPSGLKGSFGGADIRRAIEGHVLAQASIVGTYSLNPDVRARM